MPLNFFGKKPKNNWAPGAVPNTQNAYVDARLAAIAAERDINVRAALEQLDQDLQRWVFRRSPTLRELREGYEKIHRSLQSADLTINFDARGWFAAKNMSDTYAQVYERTVDAEGNVQLPSLGMNPGDLRALADDMVTIPAEWETIQPVQRGLAPRQGDLRVREKMQFGAAVAVRNNNVKTFTSGNQKFDPKAKQVFAALNYGRRPHGAAAGYGHSYFVLKPELKVRALYYPNDTFGLKDSRTASQTSFAQIATIYSKTQYNGGEEYAENCRKTLLDACYHGRPLPDTSPSGNMLLEAHIFGEVKFSESVVSVNLAKNPEKKVTDAQWEVIVGNAKAFAKRHHLKLNMIP
ncbi:MAG TPA: hypothetical protein PK156_49400 [Polyangium sp.]|nr:hypothetical protein [Polyangium sp.]